MKFWNFIGNEGTITISDNLSKTFEILLETFDILTLEIMSESSVTVGKSDFLTWLTPRLDPKLVYTKKNSYDHSPTLSLVCFIDVL